MTPSTAVTTQPAAIPVVRGPVAARDHLIRIGTRGSELAVTQTTGVARQIAAATGWDVALVIITTKGDTSPAPLAQLGGTGVFVSALRDALLAGQCDLAVHSLKDLPTGECAGITLGAIPVRADARDALCARDGLTLAELPAGARVGTGSPRRSAQLLGQRPDLDVRDLRGNVDSRLARVTNDLDAVVLAAAGLLRIGRDPAITEYFALDAVPTAPGQGALAIEARSGDVLGAGAGADVDANADAGPADAAHAAAQSVADHSAPPRPRSGVLATAITAGLAALDDPEARACALAERSVLATLEAGCQAPVGAWARREGDQLVLTGVVYESGGAQHVSETRHVAWPELRAPANAAVNAGSGTAANAAAAETVAMRLGAEVARALLESGAAELAPLTLMTGLGGQLATTAHPAPHTRQNSPGTTQNGATR